MDPMGYGFKVCEVLNMDLSHLKRGNLLPLHGYLDVRTPRIASGFY